MCKHRGQIWSLFFKHVCLHQFCDYQTLADIPSLSRGGLGWGWVSVKLYHSRLCYKTPSPSQPSTAQLASCLDSVGAKYALRNPDIIPLKGKGLLSSHFGITIRNFFTICYQRIYTPTPLQVQAIISAPHADFVGLASSSYTACQLPGAP